MVQGARPGDSGRWSCEVGGAGEWGRGWAMAGEVDIRVVRGEEPGGRQGLTGVIQVGHYLFSTSSA